MPCLAAEQPRFGAYEKRNGESNVVAHCWVRYSRLNSVSSIQHPGRLDRADPLGIVDQQLT